MPRDPVNPASPPRLLIITSMEGLTSTTNTMYPTQTLDPSSWQHTFADPENPTYEECRSLGFQFLRPGKQCIHPASTWFKDPRPSPPPLRSRRAILAQIFREHTTATASRIDTILAHYTPPDNPSLLAREQALADTPPAFPLFPLLPAEIRQQIWELAIPRRALDLREVRHLRIYTGIRNVALPIPHIAHVCREARDVVFRLGARLFIASSVLKAPDLRTCKYRKRPAGFFIKGRDIVLHLPDPRKGDEPLLEKKDPVQATGTCNEVPVEVWTVASSNVTQAMRCDAALVNWTGSTRHLNARRDPVSEYLPVSTAQSAGGWLQTWTRLKNAGGTLRTVYVYFKSRYVEVSLLVDRDFPSLGADGSEEDASRSVEVQLMADLYDDQQLAELASLETLNSDAGNTRPRYAAPGARNPGLCLNCERVQWEQHVKPLVECQWLQMHEDELEEGMVDDVFPSGTSLPYNVEHPWVKEKLRDAPEFRPAVLIHLQVAEEALLRGEEHEQWADLHSRMQSLR